MGVMILTIGVFLFVRYRTIAETYDTTMTMNEIAKINKDFVKFKDRQDIRIQEVMAVATTAASYNKQYGKVTYHGSEKDLITVKLGGIIIQNKQIGDRILDIKNKIGKKYKVSSIQYYNDDNDLYKGLIREITFNESY